MANPTNPNDTDIWGNPTTGKLECFHCGNYYGLESSTATIEYRLTYCSLECEERDRAELIAKAGISEIKPDIKPDIELRQVGDFKMKVKKEE